MSEEALGESTELSNDRFGFTLFLSICVHAVIILGVGFGLYDQFQDRPVMEVTLAQYRSEEAPEQADFIAQENQSGSGNQDERAAPSTPVEAPFQADQIQDVSPLQQQAVQMQTQERPEQSVLSTEAQSEDFTALQDEDEIPDADLPQGQVPQEATEITETLASLQAQLDVQRQAYARRPRRYTITSASTQQSRDALYLDNWRKRIEAVGNLNYPQEASTQELYGSLRLLVSIKPDGSVDNIRILRSSGHQVLDEAAIRIVNLASPFDPFPDEMRQDVDILEIIRTWQFRQGNSFSSF